MERPDEETDKVRSLEVGEINELFDETTFPTDTDDVIEEFGDADVAYPRGSDSLRTILERSGHETYESLSHLELAILNGVGRDAVGRPRYSDRSDEVGESLERTDQSF